LDDIDKTPPAPKALKKAAKAEGLRDMQGLAALFFPLVRVSSPGMHVLDNIILTYHKIAQSQAHLSRPGYNGLVPCINCSGSITFKF